MAFAAGFIIIFIWLNVGLIGPNLLIEAVADALFLLLSRLCFEDGKASLNPRIEFLAEL